MVPGLLRDVVGLPGGIAVRSSTAVPDDEIWLDDGRGYSALRKFKIGADGKSVREIKE